MNEVNKENTTLRTYIVSFIAAVVGVLLIVWGENLASGHTVIKPILNNIGSIVLATALLATIWELFVKRSFVCEIIDMMRSDYSVIESGIEMITLDFSEIIWGNYLKNNKSLDIYFAYGRTWRNHNATYLNDMSKVNGAAVRVILPDVSDELLISSMASRFGYSVERLKGEIEDAVKDFREIFQQNGENVSLKIYLCKKNPVYSMYIFDNKAIFSMYKHSRGRGGVPTFVLNNQGKLFNFLRCEFDSLIADEDITREI
ncbi:hypothetical protein [Desulfovibrio subterraneus]|uniref:Uncharacterized protein n=1 Tax=Desulfovibrio subterraneus TaxID=2718620 RepID=A0A7J0BEZ3_9BACT|nr:hypothetical protein [Desulfovibrio subterraneus]GFM32259.1 hypothetical protein DSM101010T_06240 [Desulfovibrio subterraneus]